MKSTPASHTQLARASRLHRPQQRERFRQTLVEGPGAVQELLAHRANLVRDVYYTKASLISNPDLGGLIKEAGVYHHPLNADEMQALSEDARGVVAVIDIPATPALTPTVKDAKLVLATANIQDPGNVGAIIRAADVAGCDAVLLGRGSVELWSPKVIRSSAGSIFHLPVLDSINVSKLDGVLERAGISFLAATGEGEWDLATLVTSANDTAYLGQPPLGPDLSRPVCWLLGNEAHGFADVDANVDATVAIPIYGKAESCNVAMAAAILSSTTAMIQHRP